MRRMTAGCWLFLIALAPLAHADEDYLAPDALGDAGLIKMWQLRLPLEHSQHLAGLFLAEDQLYAATNDGFVFAIHAETGANRWLRQVTQEGFPIRQPCQAGNRVIFVTPTTVLQLDLLTGEGLSRHKLDFPCGTTPVTDGTRIYLGGLDQRAYACDVHNLLHGWKAMTTGPIASTPALFEGRLYIASSDGVVFSCVAADKRFRWQSALGGSITSDLVADKHGVFVPNGDQSLYLLDLQFGQLAWQARFSGPLYEPPQLTDETAYQYCPADGLVAVNVGMVGVDERLRWKLPRGRRLLAMDDRTAIVQTLDETLVTVAAATGEVTHTVPAPGMTLGAPSPARTSVFLASPDGRVFCARPRGTPVVTQAEVREALRPAESQPAEPAAPEATSKPAAPEEPDRLTTGRKGLPLGGKSKVSKSFGKGEPAPAKPTSRPAEP